MRKIITTLIFIAASFMAQAQIPCATITISQSSGSTFNFSATPSAGIITGYNWSFGDGGNSTAAAPSHTYATTGAYTPCVVLTIANMGTITTCVVCDSLYAQSSSTPCQADFNYNLVSGNTLSFNGYGTGPGTIISYNWTFGDGGTSTLQNPTHTYSSPGWYNCCLTVSGVDSMQNPFSCTYCDSVQVGSILMPCSSNFSYNTNGLTASFLNAASGPGPITSYNWTFGDGGTSSQANPVHTYPASGLYTVCLTVAGIDSMQNPFSCTYCDSMVFVTSTSCNPSFNYNFVNSTYNFTNTSTASGTIVGYNWTFGDGGTSTQANPTHTYTMSGTMNVCLTITVIDSGATYTCQYCNTITVSASSNPCSANFSANQISGSSFYFTNTSTVSGTITGYSWTFGDGGTSTLANPTHTYSATNYYNVCLTITGYDSNQVSFICTYCDSVFAQVGGGTGCVVIAGFTNTSSSNTAVFSNTTTCTGCTSMTYNWNFGDATTSTLSNPTHTYATSGSYTVCLIATGMAGGTMCSDTDCHMIIVGSSNVNDIVNEQLKVYPNPSNDMFHIQLPDTKAYQLKLIDMAGRTIIQNTIQSNTKRYTLQASQLADGLYYMSLSDENTYLHTRVMKQ